MFSFVICHIFRLFLLPVSCYVLLLESAVLPREIAREILDLAFVSVGHCLRWVF